MRNLRYFHMNNKNNTKVIQFFNDTAREFSANYNNNPDFKERYQILTGLLNKYATAGSTALDLGCGNGVFSFYLAKKGLNVVGVDASGKMIELCEKQKSQLSLNNIRFLKGELPFIETDNIPQADLILSSSVLEYIEKFESMLDLFGRLLKQNGILIISLPNARSIYRKVEKLMFATIRRPEYFKYVKNVIVPEVVEIYLKELGFKMIEVDYYGHSPVLSKITKKLKFSPQYYNNLFVSTFKKV